MMLQIVEADNTVAILHRSVRALKERDKELHSRLKRVHDEQLHFERDIEVGTRLAGSEERRVS